MKKISLLLAPVLLITMSCAGGGETRKEDPQDSARRADSLLKVKEAQEAAQEAKEAVMDSIRLDSIRQSVGNPDLAFFNVHGPVKTLTVTSDRKDELEYCWGFRKGKYTFDAKGNWSNYKANKITELKRDTLGMIEDIVWIDKIDEKTTIDRYSWREFRPVGFEYIPTGAFTLDEGTFTYADGNIVKESGVYERQFKVNYAIVYSNFELDEQGNWISCDFESSIPDAKKDENKTDTSTGKIKRVITYYK